MVESRKELDLFALGSARDLGERVAAQLGVSLSAHEERDFEGGEHKTRPLTSVRGGDVYVLQTLHGEAGQSVNDKLCRLLFFIGALNDAGAARVTAMVPYLCYSRKDRKTKPRDPVTTRYVAALFEAVGTGRMVTLDVHNPVAYQNAFRCSSEHLEARLPFARALVPLIGADEVAVVSPDAGGVKRADRFREGLAYHLGRTVPMAFMEKYRSSGIVSGETLVGAVEGRAAVIVDDLISSGETLRRAATACRSAGATKVYALATHGVFSQDASRVLDDPCFDRIFITDSVPPTGLDSGLIERKFTVLEAAPLLARAIERLNTNGSLVELLELPQT